MSSVATRVAFAGLLLGFLASAHAALLPPKSDAVESAILRQKRAIEVYLPEEAQNDPAKRFETLYVLDGDWNGKTVSDVVDFMRREGSLIPPILVVSVPNHFGAKGENSRDRDFTPKSVDRMPNSGGAGDFLRFLKTELLPYVDQHYPANGTHLVHGHSLGGLFVIHALATDPGVFDGYIALDPSMQFGNHALDAVLSDKIPSVPPKGKALFVGGRSGAAHSEMGLDNLESILHSRAKPDLHWKMVAYEDENHNSLKLKGTYDGLRYVYGGFSQDPVGLFPASGVLVPGRPFTIRTWEGARLHYTSDGSEPSEASPEVRDGTFTVSDPRRFRLRLLSTRGVFDQDVAWNIQAGQPFAPEARVPAAPIDRAWHFTLFPPEQWPRLDSGHPFAQGEGEQEFALSTRETKRYAGVFRRQLEIPEEGYYIFGIRTKGRLLLGKNVIAEDDGTHHASGWVAYVAPLRPGSYSLTFEFLKESETSAVQLAVARDQPLWWITPPWLNLDLTPQ